MRSRVPMRLRGFGNLASARGRTPRIVGFKTRRASGPSDEAPRTRIHSPACAGSDRAHRGRPHKLAANVALAHGRRRSWRNGPLSSVVEGIVADALARFRDDVTIAFVGGRRKMRKERDSGVGGGSAEQFADGGEFAAVRRCWRSSGCGA